MTSNTERWPLPGPVAGALVVTQVLYADAGGNITVAVTPEDAARLVSTAELAVWPPGSGIWPPCNPDMSEGAAPLRLLVDTTYWPPPGPAAGDLAVIGPPGSGCAWLVAGLLRADGPSVTLAATPDTAARLMAEPVLAVWPPTTGDAWPFCDDAPVETITAAAGSVLAGGRDVEPGHPGMQEPVDATGHPRPAAGARCA